LRRYTLLAHSLELLTYLFRPRQMSNAGYG